MVRATIRARGVIGAASLALGFSIALVAGAIAVPPAFEIDGNQVTDDSTQLDWANVPDADIVVAEDESPDRGFVQGTHESDATWSCGKRTGGEGKFDLLRAYATSQPATGLLHLAFVRSEGAGDANVAFEFNAATSAMDADDCSITRSAGDLLVEYDYAGQGNGPGDTGGNSASPNGDNVGGDDSAEDKGKGKDKNAAAAGNDAGSSLTVTVSKWENGAWVDAGVSGVGATNEGGAITDEVITGGGSIPERAFGEATLDLSSLTNLLSCPGLGYLNVRSRTSRSDAALKDFLPTSSGVDLSTCGTVTVEKVDDADAPLGGALFGLFATNPAADADALDTCTTAATTGTCSLGGQVAGTYYVREITAPSGYIKSTDVDQVVIADGGVAIAGPFVNRRTTQKSFELTVEGTSLAPTGVTYRASYSGMGASGTLPLACGATDTTTDITICTAGPVTLARGSYDMDISSVLNGGATVIQHFEDEVLAVAEVTNFATKTWTAQSTCCAPGSSPDPTFGTKEFRLTVRNLHAAPSGAEYLGAWSADNGTTWTDVPLTCVAAESDTGTCTSSVQLPSDTYDMKLVYVRDGVEAVIHAFNDEVITTGTIVNEGSYFWPEVLGEVIPHAPRTPRVSPAAPATDQAASPAPEPVVAGRTLPRTGLELAPMLVLSGALITAGGLLMLLGRRREVAGPGLA